MNPEKFSSQLKFSFSSLPHLEKGYCSSLSGEGVGRWSNVAHSSQGAGKGGGALQHICDFVNITKLVFCAKPHLHRKMY